MDLKGKNVIVLAANYIYEGILDHETHDGVYLRGIDDRRGPRIVYATGEWAKVSRAGSGEIAWRNAEYLPVKIQKIERSSIESYGELSI